VLALHLPQRLANGEVCHDLYLLNVGDSRAYWMTGDRCRQLTLDDDVATQLTRQQQATYHQASLDGSNGALTQALGIFPSATLRVAVQRFPVEEEGILFLCSDGVSDFDLVERFAVPETRRLLAGEVSLAAWTEAWIARANQLNGHDNATVAAMHCSLTAAPPEAEPERTVATRPQTEPPRTPVRLGRDLLGLVGGFSFGLVLTMLLGLQPPLAPAPIRSSSLSPAPVGK
jgi:serine/threonine protein phosphatase PrpC